MCRRVLLGRRVRSRLLIRGIGLVYLCERVMVESRVVGELTDDWASYFNQQKDIVEKKGKESGMPMSNQPFWNSHAC